MMKTVDRQKALEKVYQTKIAQAQGGGGKQAAMRSRASEIMSFDHMAAFERSEDRNFESSAQPNQRRSRSVSPSWLAHRSGLRDAVNYSSFEDDDLLLHDPESRSIRGLATRKSGSPPVTAAFGKSKAAVKRSHPYLDSKATRSRSTAPTKKVPARNPTRATPTHSSGDPYAAYQSTQSSAKKKLSKVESRLYSSVYGTKEESAARHQEERLFMTPKDERSTSRAERSFVSSNDDLAHRSMRETLEGLKAQIGSVSSKNKQLSDDYESLRTSLVQRNSGGVSSFSIDALLPPRLSQSPTKEPGETEDRDLKKALARKDVTLKTYQSQLQHLESQKHSLQSELSVLRHELKEHVSHAPAQDDQMRDMMNQNKILQATVKKMQEEISAKNDDIANLKREKMQLEIKVKEAKVDSSKDVQDKERELTTLMRRMDLLQTRAADLEKEIAERDRSIAALSKKLEEETAALRKTQDMDNTHKRQMQSLLDKCQALVNIKKVPYCGLSAAQYSSLQEDVASALETHQTQVFDILSQIEGESASRTSTADKNSEQSLTFDQSAGSVGIRDNRLLQSELAEIETREQELYAKEKELLVKRRRMDDELFAKRSEVETLKAQVMEKQEELQSIEASKQLINNLQDKLNEREKELEERDRLFERTIKQQQQEFDEKRRELQIINEHIAKMVEQQKAIATKEAEVEEKEMELSAKESELKTKEQENQSMLEHLLSVLESQQSRDRQAQEELQKGYQILQQKYADVAEKERVLNEMKQRLDSAAQQQAAVVTNMSRNKDELARQKAELENARRNVETMVQQKRREVMGIDEVISRKQRELQQLQQKEHGVQELLQKLAERERVFSERDRQFHEVAKKRQQEMQQLEEVFNVKRRDLAKLQQMVGEKMKEKEALEKAEMNNRINEYKMEERLQKKRKELEEVENAIRQKRNEFTSRQTSMPVTTTMDPMYDSGSSFGLSQPYSSSQVSFDYNGPLGPDFSSYSSYGGGSF
jgi:chromosome segregation ATPase